MKNAGFFVFNLIFVPILILIVLVLSGTIKTQKVFGFVDCLKITPASSEADKNYCKNELAKIEAELAELLEKQKVQQKQTGTLKGDVTYLNSQINALQTKIKSRAIAIAQLRISINEKVNKLESLSEKIKREHGHLAELIRNTNEFDNDNFLYLVLSDDTVSDFFSNVESYASIRKAVRDSIDKIRGVRRDVEVEKKGLEEKQNAETDAKVELEESKKKVSKSETEKKQLLAISQNKESEYQKLAAEKRARAEKIRAALFSLRDAQAIPFGIALEYAKDAEKVTGVRPAFVLAILTQETNLGANVGSCIITNLSTGETKSINTGNVFSNGIHPTRDLPLLQTIVKELGRDPLSTKVSCPQSVGYGGAMGPAQFIPSTWNLIKSQIATAVGKTVPDPWNPADAIMASSILLKGNGANGRTYTAEREAACRYYSGRGCSDPKVKNTFYGNAVMSHATKIQSNIDYLNQYGVSSN
ncbi:MAG: lytic murein transglycosylase [Candidatus Pacebacteria bacterium]|nr:lytic murein transglycosylase [Candidatus Paceibacterota bacterium]MCF7863132.1 lytic murein transglycosylase [Candidatus Paceibacterota bacterium]